MGRSEDVSDELWINGPWEQVHHGCTAILAKVCSYTSGSSGDNLRQIATSAWVRGLQVAESHPRQQNYIHPDQLQSDILLRLNHPQRPSVIRQAKTDTRMLHGSGVHGQTSPKYLKSQWEIG
ncbi:hypothetical protein CY34DRAFT_814255 [Suillus luteus UH-Slu-Lm8-n1]|uniref:Unplaced genomic scaffold CY34scaffold_1096, whole genome shotgun sequence n=1 Tax=Suillus luteus UH-Slu-Lm8-n1 TaxID=930992 RepID=A0A0D0AKT2_9AGAM|nr:hypothetical protein CY34DRAFT_814255 [Suillus luteus UH-Slu-Lm8-n1]